MKLQQTSNSEKPIKKTNQIKRIEDKKVIIQYYATDLHFLTCSLFPSPLSQCLWFYHSLSHSRARFTAHWLLYVPRAIYLFSSLSLSCNLCVANDLLRPPIRVYWVLPISLTHVRNLNLLLCWINRVHLLIQVSVLNFLFVTSTLAFFLHPFQPFTFN